MKKKDTDIIVIGGGPVGLYLAIRLIQGGVSCRVLEKRTSIDKHSKSLGIHPVSLDLFEKTGIIDSFLRDGLKIKKGIAYWNTEKLGEITFENCPPPYQYILALPQWRTEEILENKLHSLDESALVRGADVNSIVQNEESVEVHLQEDGEKKSITGRYLAGCDGKNSISRKSSNIKFIGEAYRDCYMMGDFEDTTQFGPDAAVYLHSDGLIESFPLPNGQRRWVVKTDQYVDDPTAQMIAHLIHERIRHILYGSKNFMVSSFGVQHYSAEQYAKQHLLLAGDSAHVVSPIGGQGMNLGWLDAEEAASVLIKALKKPSKQFSYFQEYSKKRKNIAKQVAKRAELNMHLGRKETSTLSYKLILSIILKTKLNRVLGKIFTMRGLGKWWI